MNNSDPAAELRGRIVSLTLACPRGYYEVDCPFLMFHGLCDGTKKSTLAQMDHSALLRLFDYSAHCRCPADPRHPAQDPPTGGGDS